MLREFVDQELVARLSRRSGRPGRKKSDFFAPEKSTLATERAAFRSQKPGGPAGRARRGAFFLRDVRRESLRPGCEREPLRARLRRKKKQITGRATLISLLQNMFSGPPMKERKLFAAPGGGKPKKQG